MTTDTGFVAQYFSDGTYDAYRKYRSRNANEPESAKSDPSFACVFEDEPVKGQWDTSDGFFQLQSDSSGKRSYVGTVMFEPPVPGGMAPSGWEGAHKAPDPVQHADGNWSQVGPALFRGLAYSGTPGGRIKAI